MNEPADFPLGPQRPAEFAPVLAEDFSIVHGRKHSRAPFRGSGLMGMLMG